MAQLPEKPIGSYKILDELGYGGSAAVYLAQKEDDSRKVALKVLYPHAFREPGLVKRFEREARTVAKLNHPNIIRIFDTQYEGEFFFIAMEYISGGTLRERLEENESLSRSEAVDIVKSIGAALKYAHKHEHKIIHRDLKPENILLDTRQKPIRPILTDFGLAKSLSVEDPTAASIVTRNVIGSPHYMAPEQWHNEVPTPTTDLYTLAIIFFEMLAGQRPFEANSPSELLQKHLNEPLPLLSSIASDVGPFFDDILIRAAAKNPSNRFKSVAEFIEAVEEANAQAEEVERDRSERQSQAAKMIEAAQVYLQRDNYDPDIALTIIEAALEVDPECVEALSLKGKIYSEQKQFTAALEAYEQAYQRSRTRSSEVIVDYLEALRKNAEISWNGGDHQGAINYCHRIVKVLGENDYEDECIQQMRTQVWSWLIEFYQSEGDKAYAQGNPADLDEAIRILDKQIQCLDKLKADSKRLWYKKQALQVKKYKDKIEAEEKAIAEIYTESGDTHFGSEDVIQHYRNMDECYQNLIDLVESERKFEWEESRREKLKEQAESRVTFALKAAAEPEPDYETAIRHYEAIRDIEESHRYPNLSEELNLNLTEKIADLEKKADYYNKYSEIQVLINQGKYSEALRQLTADFIDKGNYEYRNVADLLSLLVQAKKNDWQLPAESAGESGVKTLSVGLVRAARARVELLKITLEPWSNLSEIIAEQHNLLVTCEKEIEAVEARLSEAKAPEKIPGIEGYHDELARVREEIEAWHTRLQQIEVDAALQKIETWLQKLDEIEVNLKEYYRFEEIQKFFSRSDAELTAIEEDPLFVALQALTPTSLALRRTIHKIQAQLISVLAQDINQRKEELTKVQNNRNLLLFVGIVSALINLLLGFIFWDRVNLLTKGIIGFPLIAIVILVTVMFTPNIYQRIRRR